MKEKEKLVNSAIFITILLFCSKGLGFIREILIAYKFGTSYIVDAYTICITLPSVVFTVFASGFSQSYVPVYTRITNEKEKNIFFSNVVNLLLIVSILVCLCCLSFSDGIVSIMAPGFDERTRNLTVIFIRIVSFIFPVMTVFNILSAHLSTSEDFIFANFCDYVVVNVIIIISILLANKQRSWMLSGGYVLALFCATVFLIMYSFRRKKVIYKPYIKIKNSSFKILYTMAIPLGLSLLVNQLNTVIDRIFASTLGEGVTSSLNYADKVQSIFLTLTTSIFLTVCYPRINMYFAKNDKLNGLYYIKKAISIAFYTSIPLVAILLFYATPIIRVLFQKGEFSVEATEITANCLMCYSLGVPFYALREILTKTLAANEKQKLIFKNTVISVGCNIILNLFFIKALGYIGLALATSISGMISSLLLGLDVKKSKLQIIDEKMKTNFFKIIICLLISMIIGKVIIYFLFEILCKSDIIVILGLIITGMIYILMSILLKVDIVQWLVDNLIVRHNKVK